MIFYFMFYAHDSIFTELEADNTLVLIAVILYSFNELSVCQHAARIRKFCHLQQTHTDTLDTSLNRWNNHTQTEMELTRPKVYRCNIVSIEMLSVLVFL